MGNHDPYSDPSGGDYREGKQGAEGLFPHPASDEWNLALDSLRA